MNIEIKIQKEKNGPKILVIGVGGGGNNALDRMILSNVQGVNYMAVNTDIQVLDSCQSEIKVQIGKKITDGYGAGASPEIGETSALENEEEIKNAITGADMCIITCGMGGGTGTGASPVIARYCREMGILTVGVVTTPFSFESIPRVKAAEQGVEKLKENVDTLLVIPNDKLLCLSDKPLLLEDAFQMADSVLKYTIEGITNIVYNKGTINIDFNDLKATLINKGIGHLGIGSVDVEESVLEAIKQAVNSPLLETSIQGAENILINTCGKVNVLALNEAIGYVRELAGSQVNIIWGTVSGENFEEDKIVVTLIATGMPNIEQVKPDNLVINMNKPSFQPNMEQEASFMYQQPMQQNNTEANTFQYQQSQQYQQTQQYQQPQQTQQFMWQNNIEEQAMQAQQPRKRIESIEIPAFITNAYQKKKNNKK